GDHHLLASPAEGLGDEPLVVAEVAVVEAVDVGRVDERHAHLQRGVDGADGLRLLRPAVDGQVHAAEPYLAHQTAPGPQPSLLHRLSLRPQRSTGATPSPRRVSSPAVSRGGPRPPRRTAGEARSGGFRGDPAAGTWLRSCSPVPS